MSNTLKFAAQHTRRISVIGALVVALLVLLLNYATENGGHAYSRIVRFKSDLKDKGSIVAVINTPKMGTGGLCHNFIQSWRCKNGLENTSYLTYNCPNERIVVRAHQIKGAMQAVQNHRRRHPDGKCLIVTAIRSPEPWLPSLYVQRQRLCNNISMTKEEMLQDYKQWLGSVKNVSQAFESCLPELLKEFNGGSLVEQAEIMDRNNGYSMVESTSDDSVFAGCELLFLRMEQNDRWPEIIKMMVPENKFHRGESRAAQCPKLADHIKMLQEYELTKEEKMAIYTNGGASVADWFDAYEYINGE